MRANRADDNDEDGIQAVCPSTIINNEVARNAGEPIRPIGAGCFIKGNVTVGDPS